MNMRIAVIIGAALFAAPSLSNAAPLMPAVDAPPQSRSSLVAAVRMHGVDHTVVAARRRSMVVLPNGYYQERPVASNACPPGYWRGPWGHCRNTPYHGRLPNGSWK
jgi:hypothetical protein